MKTISPVAQDAVNEAIKMSTEAAIEYAASIGKVLDLRAFSREIRIELRAVLVPAIQALRAAHESHVNGIREANGTFYPLMNDARRAFMEVLFKAGVKAAERSFFEPATN